MYTKISDDKNIKHLESSEENYISYMITIFGTLKTETNDLEKQKQELFTTNKQYLISHADEIFLEVDKRK